MNAQRIAISALLVLAALSGCAPDHTPPAPETKPVEPTVFDPMVSQMDRAKAQGQQMENRVNDLNKQLEKTE